MNAPWIVLGDFNCVMFSNERIGSIVRDAEIVPFQHTAQMCDLQDIKAIGAFYTWTNKQPSITRVFSRIDRVLINGAWLALKPDYYAHYLLEGDFDHCPCILECGNVRVLKKKPFKFFNMWCHVKDFKEIVQQRWGDTIDGTTMFQLVKNLKDLKPALKNLNKCLFSDVETNADLAYHLLLDCQKKLQKDPTNCVLMDVEAQTKESYLMLKKPKEEFLK
ncbi:uncharacterized protein LOC141608082 [Silene latifolia]|uniref:uncharacterized protein LOC141608082 n=1 Tax=Silene latifolia TaxID=37657 RepID=UPI003D779A71